MPALVAVQTKFRELAAATLIVAASLFLSSPPARAETAPTFVNSQQPGEVSASALIGVPVVNGAGETIGNINYLILDPKGQVTTVAVGVGGFLGVGEKNVGVAMSSLTIVEDPTTKKRQAKLEATKDQLTAAPEYVWLEKPLAVRVDESIKSATETVKDAGQKAKESIENASKPADEPATTSTP